MCSGKVVKINQASRNNLLLNAINSSYIIGDLISIVSGISR